MKRRHLAVFQAAWAARHALAGPPRLAHEAAFLPDAMRLQETPVHPAPRRALWLIMALFTAAVAWSVLGQVDIVAVSPGRLVVSDRSKTLQAPEAGVVHTIHVRDGDRVQAGDLLVELDPTIAQADARGTAGQRQNSEELIARTERLLQALDAGQAPDAQGLAPAQLALLDAEWREFQARQSRLEAEQARRQAELQTARQLLAKIESTLPLARQREADFLQLQRDGAVAAHAAQDRSRERQDLERDLATQRARLAEAEATAAETREAAQADRAAVRRQWHERLTQSRHERGQWAQQERKTAQRERLTRILAPVSGTVQQRSVHTPGSGVTAGQALMVIVPEDAPLQVEVAVAHHDVGFVRAGQAVELKLEAFSFTRYGTLPGVVRHLSHDAVTDDKGQSHFVATVTPERTAIEVDGRAVPLTAGMAVTAEIKTGRRRVIEFVWSPVVKTVGEGLRER